MQPVRMTRAEYEALYGTAPVVTDAPLDTTPAPVRMTREEYQQTYFPTEKSLFANLKSEAGKDIKETTQAIKETVQQGVERTGEIKQREQIGETGKVAGTFQRFGRGLSTLGNVAFEAVIGGAKIINPFENVEKKIADTASKFVEDLTGYNQAYMDNLRNSSNETDRQIARQIDTAVNLYQKDANFRDTVDAAGGVLGWLAIPPAGKAASRGGKAAIEIVADTVVDPVKNQITEVTTRVNKYQGQKAVTNIVNELAAVEDKYKPSRRAADIEPDANGSRTRIATSGVLENAVDQNGLIRTNAPGGAVDQYKKLTIDGLEDVVRKNLENEGSKINLNELADDMRIAVLDSGMEGRDLASAILGIENELKGLKMRADAFGDVPLYRVHDAKIATTNHIDYTKPTGVTYRKTIARVYKEAVEKKSKFNVKEVNKELAKYYTDIERLKRLDGARVEGGRLGKYTAQLAGTAVGGFAGSVGGAGGAVIGGIVGGEISSAVKGRMMARTFKGSPQSIQKNAVLDAAKKRAEKGGVDLTTPDKPVGVPSAIMRGAKLTPEQRKKVVELEAKIKKNVKAQEAAIKAGDFTLVQALKEVYQSLKNALSRLVDEIKESAKNPSVGLSIRKSVTPESVARAADPEDIRLLARVIDDPSLAKTDPDVRRILYDMGLSRATEDELVRFAKDVIDTRDGVADRQVLQRDLNENQNQATAAPTIAQNISDTVQDTADNVNIPQTTTLLEEARGKTLEEFVKAQGTPVYHGTTHKWEGKFKEDRPIFVTKDKKFAENVASEQVDNAINKFETEIAPNGESYYPTIKDAFLDKNSKIFSINNQDDLKNLVDRLPEEFNITNHYVGGKHKITKAEWLKEIQNNKNNWTLFEGDVIDEIKKMGYDGWEATEKGANSIGLFNQKVLKTRTQLEDIWKKANQ